MANCDGTQMMNARPDGWRRSPQATMTGMSIRFAVPEAIPRFYGRRAEARGLQGLWEGSLRVGAVSRDLPVL
jgi:hypothetical protein